ncbi:MAG: carbohydrate ABC transporter permease [Anaerolineaceae bacterium]|nr:carbohydrate ABC transporter permease [Anaerolineaceae bacterium]
MNRTQKNLASQFILWFLLLSGVVITVFPLVYMVSTSLKGPIFVFEMPPKIIPSKPSLDNFFRAWNSNNFERYFLNSLAVTSICTVVVIFLSSMMAYAFARFEFRLKKTLFYIVIFFMMLPSMTLIVPQFTLAVKLKLINKLSGLFYLYVAQNIPLATFLLQGFMALIPVEIEEAARIDGATPWQVYWRIMLPLCGPAIATAAIFASLGTWDEFVWANTILNKPNIRTLPVAIASFQGTHNSDWGLIFAASIMAVLPVIIIFIALQRFFVKGAASGAIKG